ncbi:Orotidine 5'-phosphate decarboxylase [Pseudomassariella vexata]|uniref:Orotidine 5'-phosphate decarboxylase n=1 Tax=Pseudomassariella vexata TaxID=1141098 RepID=A0A1Y2EFE1_9PEZI|nr:Orotidine 5'-phosphate decarboxylase [Pseudomassariella vexata]ORY70269.1 Orotidine 5'-phosphate decarboxylase [Pseudomassariella vexata]
MTYPLCLTYGQRAAQHPNPVARRLFEIAKAKQSNLVVSADLTGTESLLKCADSLGPYIAVFKTHIEIVKDFSNKTVQGLKLLAQKHNFLIFEDRKLIDIGNTVQKQYHGGALQISEWADVVSLSVLGGDGIVDALVQTITTASFPHRGQRALLILAEMTSEGSLATRHYTEECVEVALSQNPEVVLGFVATKALHTSDVASGRDFVTFTTGISLSESGDELGQHCQTPASAISRGSDFIIADRGIYAAEVPVDAARRYQEAGWKAYLQRTHHDA